MNYQPLESSPLPHQRSALLKKSSLFECENREWSRKKKNEMVYPASIYPKAKTITWYEHQFAKSAASRDYILSQSHTHKNPNTFLEKSYHNFWQEHTESEKDYSREDYSKRRGSQTATRDPANHALFVTILTHTAPFDMIKIETNIFRLLPNKTNSTVLQQEENHHFYCRIFYSNSVLKAEGEKEEKWRYISAYIYHIDHQINKLQYRANLL